MTTAPRSLKDTGREYLAGGTSGPCRSRRSRAATSSAAATLASHSARPGSAEARRMTVTSGLSCLASSRHSGPLGACLKTLLGTSAWGSTVSGLTWKLRATPCNRSLFQLAPLTPRTAATGSGFWPTPKASPSGPDFARTQRQGSGGHDLATAVTALWPTPLAGDATGSRSSKGSRRPGEGGLRRMATEVALWPTPRASDGEKGSPNQGLPERDAHPDGAGPAGPDAVGDPYGTGLPVSQQPGESGQAERGQDPWPAAGQRGGSPWAGAKWVLCRDGRVRAVAPGVPLLAYGVPDRVGQAKAYGNTVISDIVEIIGRAILAAQQEAA